MKPKRRPFQRPLGQRRYRKRFIIAVEGAKTEPQYFAIFNNEQSVIQVQCLRGRHDSSPPQVLKRMELWLDQEALLASDEAWLVVDKDHWTEDQLTQLHAWAQTKVNYGFALSNPKFEYWLLLHFEDGNEVANSQNCTDRLKKYLPGFDKGIDSRKFTSAMMNDAIRRARQRDNPPCEDWPRTAGTTVYRLVERIHVPAC